MLTHVLSAPIFGHAGLRAHLDDTAMLAAMLRVETSLAEVQAEMGIIPRTAAEAIAGLSIDGIDLLTIRKGVATSGVPVPAFIAQLRSALPPDAADWLHYGATSQDIVDSAWCICFGHALDDLAMAMGQVIDRLETLSLDHRETIMLARTRGQIATPITFGLRAANWTHPMIALENDLAAVRHAALRVQFGGGSGSRNVMGPVGADLASALAGRLGLSDSPPWHGDRSGIARLAGWLTQLVAAAAKMGGDVAMSARGEIGELSLSNGGGSSTMPHKSNPVIAEAMQSLHPVAVGVQTGLSTSTVHAEERDGAQWPVEWALMPAAFELAGAAMAHSQTLLSNLTVHADEMRRRVEASPQTKAEAAVFALAPSVGRAEATKRVAGTRGDPTDLPVDLPDSHFTAPATATAKAIFATRIKT